MERQIKMLTREIDLAHWTAVDNVLSSRDKYAVIAHACCDHFGVPRTEVYSNRRVGGRIKGGGMNDPRTRVRVCLCAIFVFDFGIQQSELVNQFGQYIRHYTFQWKTDYERIFYTDKKLDAAQLALMDDICAIYQLSIKLLDERGLSKAANHLRTTTSEKRMSYAG